MSAADSALRAFHLAVHRDNAAQAHALANRTQGPFVGVVLATNATATGPGHPTWHAYAAPSREELSNWFLDWSGTPSTYYYLAIFNKYVEDWDHQTPVAFATGNLSQMQV